MSLRNENDLTPAWFLGIIGKDKYYEKSVFWWEGEIDPDNGFDVKSDCYIMAIRDIWEEFVKEFWQEE